MNPLVGSDRGSSEVFDRFEDDLNEDMKLPNSEDILILPRGNTAVRILGLIPAVLICLRVTSVFPNKILIAKGNISLARVCYIFEVVTRSVI